MSINKRTKISETEKKMIWKYREEDYGKMMNQSDDNEYGTQQASAETMKKMRQKEDEIH